MQTIKKMQGLRMPSAQAGKTSNGLPVKYALNIPPNMNKSECVPSLKRLQPYLGKYGYPLWYLQYMCQKRGCTFVKKKQVFLLLNGAGTL